MQPVGSPNIERKKWYVYALEKPTGEIFYVGRGTGNRIDQHEWEARSGVQSRKCDVIREVWAQRQQIVKKIIFETDVEEDSKRVERDCIQFEYAGPQLTNIVGNMYELTRRREERRQEMWQLVQKRVQEIERRQWEEKRREKRRMRLYGD